MDIPEHQKVIFAHYLQMAKSPAQSGQAWLRVRELAEGCPGSYGDLPAKLADAILDFYLPLARHRVTKMDAWQAVKALARDWPDMCGELPARLTEAVRQEAADAKG